MSTIWKNAPRFVTDSRNGDIYHLRYTYTNHKGGFSQVVGVENNIGQRITSASVRWVNRTWEAWEYHEVCKKLARTWEPAAHMTELQEFIK